MFTRFPKPWFPYVYSLKIQFQGVAKNTVAYPGGGAAGLLPPPELSRGGPSPLGICPLLGVNLPPHMKIILKKRF